MTRKLIKITIAITLFSTIIFNASTSKAFPGFLRQAKKFGAKDCQFCHTEPSGGDGWNDRGKWLITEKEKRKSDSVDVEWLSEYKDGNKDSSNKTDKTDKKDESQDGKGDSSKEKPKN